MMNAGSVSGVRERLVRILRMSSWLYWEVVAEVMIDTNGVSNPAAAIIP